MSDLPIKCWKVTGIDIYAGERRAITYFCAQAGTFYLSFTFHVRTDGVVVKAIEICFNDKAGRLVALLKTNVLKDGGEQIADSFNSYQSSDDLGLYIVEGDCAACGCDTKTHCRIECPNTLLGYCCMEKEKLKNMAALVRDVSGNRR